MSLTDEVKAYHEARRRAAGIAPRAPASRNGIRVRLRENQTRDVERVAREMGISVQDLVRGCLDRFLTITTQNEAERALERELSGRERARLAEASLTRATKPSKSRGRNRGTK